MLPTPNLDIQAIEWWQAKTLSLPLRIDVFVNEQGVDESEEVDQYDDFSIHLIAIINGEVVGTGRLTPQGQLGRIAVKKTHRKQGIGIALINALLNCAHERGLKHVSLLSQLHAISLYEHCGFKAEDGIVMDAGIEHKKMTLALSKLSTTQARKK